MKIRCPKIGVVAMMPMPVVVPMMTGIVPVCPCMGVVGHPMQCLLVRFSVPVVGDMMMVMVIVMVMIMAVTALVEESGAGEVHRKPNDCNNDRIREVDRNRRDKTLQRLPRNQEGNQSQHDGAREGGQITDLTGSVGEPRVVAMPFCIAVSRCRNQESTCMGGHVPAIGEEGHGTEQGAGHDFGDHHRRRQRDHEPRPQGIAIVVSSKEHMTVRLYHSHSRRNCPGMVDI
jgi:hypothetical protein